MNNGVVFTLGLLTGAAAGGVATYFIVKDKFEQRAAEEIEAYAQHAEERLQNYISSHYDVDDLDEPEEEKKSSKSADVPVHDDDVVSQNPGVKKYHHYQSGFIPAKEEINVTKGQEDILKRPQLEDVPGIEELDEDEFNNLDDDRYTRVYLQYDANEDTLFTNDGDIAEDAYAKTRHELIGNAWRWATDYVDKDGMFYIQNDNLNIAFAVEVAFDPDKDMVEV